MQNNNARQFLKFANSLLFLTLVIGLLFFPTSVNGYIKESVSMRTNIIVLSSILLCLLNGKINIKRIPYFFLIQITFYLFTFFSILREPNIFTWNIGSYLLITVLSLIFVFDFKFDAFNVKFLRYLFFCLNIITIIWALGIIFNIESIDRLTLNNFSQYSDWTLSTMLGQNKPVYSFGTHSFSALFTFLMLLVNLVDFEKKLGVSFIVNFFIVNLYLFILIMIQSTTSLLFFGFSIISIAYIFKKTKHNYTFYWFITAIFLCIPLLSTLALLRPEMIFDKYNGFQERYMGNLFDSTISFVKSYIAIGMLRPLNEQVMLIDSGIINFLLKGNVLLIYFYYKLFYKFTRDNLAFLGIVVFISFSLFEIGVSFFSMDARAIAMLLFALIMIKAKQKYNFNNK